MIRIWEFLTATWGYIRLIPLWNIMTTLNDAAIVRYTLARFYTTNLYLPNLKFH